MLPVKSVPRNKSNRQRERTRVSLICQSVFFRESVGVERKKKNHNKWPLNIEQSAAYIDLIFVSVVCTRNWLFENVYSPLANTKKKRKIEQRNINKIDPIHPITWLYIIWYYIIRCIRTGGRDHIVLSHIII